LTPINKPTPREQKVMQRILALPAFRLEPVEGGYIIWRIGNLGSRPGFRISSLDELLDWIEANRAPERPPLPEIDFEL
jgi:hypothetical protein